MPASVNINFVNIGVQQAIGYRTPANQVPPPQYTLGYLPQGTTGGWRLAFLHQNDVETGTCTFEAVDVDETTGLNRFLYYNGTNVVLGDGAAGEKSSWVLARHPVTRELMIKIAVGAVAKKKKVAPVRLAYSRPADMYYLCEPNIVQGAYFTQFQVVIVPPLEAAAAGGAKVEGTRAKKESASPKRGPKATKTAPKTKKAASPAAKKRAAKKQ